MKFLIIPLFTLLIVGGCTATERGATVGGLGGAAVGAAATGNVEGAAIGGAVGAAAGALIGRASEPGDCIYRARDGSRYVAPCP